jgi:hypothetical protein
MSDPHSHQQLEELGDRLRLALYRQGAPRRIGLVTRAIAAQTVPRRGRREERADRGNAGHARFVPGLVIVSSVLVVCAVTIGALTLGHSAAPRGASATQGVAALLKRLAVLRRPQTAADRSYPYRAPAVQARAGVIARNLTRLATTTTAATGPVRVYVIIRKFPARQRSGRAGLLTVNAFAVDAHDQLAGATGPLTAAMIGTPGNAGSRLIPAKLETSTSTGVTVGIVPDGVIRVKWVFSGAGFGITHARQVTVYPPVRQNVAAAANTSGQGPLASATWYGARGQVVASGTANTQTQQLLQAIRSVNASRRRAIAPFLLAHFGVFRSVPADTPAQDPRLPTPGTGGGYVGEMGLNYWKSRYLPAVTGLDGPGLWITPGARGLCISDPQVSFCGTLTSRDSIGFIGPGATSPAQQTLSGLVPNGNSMVTLVLADGTHRTVPVAHNIWETTVRGRIVAIIDRNVAGQIESRSVQ